jgi:hypothetical protein
MILEKVLSATGLCVLVTAMAAVNEQFGQFLAGLTRGELSTNVTFVGDRSLNMGRMVIATASSYTADNMTLVGFGVGAVVLLGLMMRS